MHMIGIDIGTSAVKAVLVEFDGQGGADGAGERIVTQASVALAIDRPRPGWFEQDPEAWWRAVERAVAMLSADAPAAFADVGGIGLSGQMHALVALDAAGEAIRPAMLWNDGRAVAECAVLADAVPGLAEIAGIIAMPGFTAPKLMWVRRHEPAAFAGIAHVVAAKDYVRARMTGMFATDMSDAAAMLLLDEARREWSAPILAAVGIDGGQLPRLHEGTASTGTLRRAVAERWGLARRVIVAAGAGDSAAGAIGVGAVEEGDSFISLGTSAQIFVTRDRYAPKPAMLVHAFAHALPGRWFEQAALLNGAAALDWVAGLLGTDVGKLIETVAANFSGPSRVMFLPYLAGERTPLNDPEARGVFAHLEYACGPNDLAQAVMEGIAFSLIDGQRAFGEATRDAIPMIGGGARSRFFVRLIASALGRPIQRVAGGEAGPAFGAARLARLALTGEAVAAVCRRPVIAETIDPEPELQARYAERFVTFGALYRALRRARSATADRHPAATR
jgi:xylulokinase